MVASALFANTNDEGMSQNDLLRENTFGLRRARGAGSYVQAIASVAVPWIYAFYITPKGQCAADALHQNLRKIWL